MTALESFLRPFSKCTITFDNARCHAGDPNCGRLQRHSGYKPSVCSNNLKNEMASRSKMRTVLPTAKTLKAPRNQTNRRRVIHKRVTCASQSSQATKVIDTAPASTSADSQAPSSWTDRFEMTLSCPTSRWQTSPVKTSTVPSAKLASGMPHRPHRKLSVDFQCQSDMLLTGSLADALDQVLGSLKIIDFENP